MGASKGTTLLTTVYHVLQYRQTFHAHAGIHAVYLNRLAFLRLFSFISLVAELWLTGVRIIWACIRKGVLNQSRATMFMQEEKKEEDKEEEEKKEEEEAAKVPEAVSLLVKGRVGQDKQKWKSACISLDGLLDYDEEDRQGLPAAAVAVLYLLIKGTSGATNSCPADLALTGPR